MTVKAQRPHDVEFELHLLTIELTSGGYGAGVRQQTRINKCL